MKAKICCSFTIILSLFFKVVWAEERSLERIIECLQDFYIKVNDYTAYFEQEYRHRLLKGKRKRARGIVYIKKPGLMRWEYKQPQTKLFISDKKFIWMYDLKAKQVYRQKLSESELPGAVAFLMGKGELKKDFFIRLVSKKRHGEPVLELRPKRPSPHYIRLLFVVDSERCLVKKTVIIDQARNLNIFTFRDIRINQKIPKSRFKFKPPREAEIITP
jgi:outer membrane lipoprotein carrier protein